MPRATGSRGCLFAPNTHTHRVNLACRGSLPQRWRAGQAAGCGRVRSSTAASCGATSSSSPTTTTTTTTTTHTPCARVPSVCEATTCWGERRCLPVCGQRAARFQCLRTGTRAGQPHTRTHTRHARAHACAFAVCARAALRAAYVGEQMYLTAVNGLWSQSREGEPLPKTP